MEFSTAGVGAERKGDVAVPGAAAGAAGEADRVACLLRSSTCRPGRVRHSWLARSPIGSGSWGGDRPEGPTTVRLAEHISGKGTGGMSCVSVHLGLDGWVPSGLASAYLGERKAIG